MDGQFGTRVQNTSRGSEIDLSACYFVYKFIVRTPKVAPLCKTAHVSLLHVAEFDQASISPISLDGLYMYAYHTLQ